MTLGNVRALGVHHLDALCLNPNCRHQMVLNVDRYADYILVQLFASKMGCAKVRHFRSGCSAELERASEVASLVGKEWR
jgi:hypothetical protein